MKRFLLTYVAASLSSFAVIAAEPGEDPTIDRLLASQCAQCHGTNGFAVHDMDSLDDESYKDLYEDLMDMRGEDRAEDIMEHQAMGYTNDQVRRIARYYGTVSGKASEAPEFESEEDEDR